MRQKGEGTGKFYGGRLLETYPAEKLYREAAFIGYYLHWSRQEILSLSHLERIRWCRQISQINRELNNEPENIFAV